MMSQAGTPRTLGRKTFLILAVVILLGAIVIVITAAIFFYHQIPDVDDLVPQNPAPIVITIHQPLNQSNWPGNAPIEIQAKVYSAIPINSLELWVNGSLQETSQPQASTGAATFEWEWTWQPDEIGESNLFTRAYSSDGQMGTSNVVHLNIVNAETSHIVHTVEARDTIESLAGKFGTSPEAINDENPELDSGVPLPVGETINIPIFDKTSPITPTLPDYTPYSRETTPTELQNPTDLNLWLASNLSSPQTPPMAPGLEISVESSSVACTVHLIIFDNSEDEAGFFVYRNDGDNPNFERAAMVAANDKALPLQFSDTPQNGAVTYYVASYNLAGEGPSNPVSINTISACGITPPSDLNMDGGVLSIPEPVDSLYLYLSINGGDWQRIPANPDWFLVSKTNQFDLNPFIDQLGGLLPNSMLTMEVWGWQGGQLSLLGTMTKILSRTELWGCSQAGECQQGLGWFSEITIPSDAQDQDRQFRWTTDAPGATAGIWQVSTQPFPETSVLDPPGLLQSGDAGEAVPGTYGKTFLLDFAQLAAILGGTTPSPPTSTEGSSWLFPLISNIQMQSPYATFATIPDRIFYVRVIPMSGNQPTGDPSNTTIVHYHPAIEQDNPLLPIPPDIYEVEIIGFDPIIPPYLPWGCVLIKDIDHDTFVNSIINSYGGFIDEQQLAQFAENAYQTALAAQQNQTPLCPQPYQGEGDKPWYESMWDFVSGALSWVSETFDDIKNAVVDLAAEALDALPGIECGDNCKFLLKKGLEAGLMALGIPPDIPNLDQLTDQGMEYLIEVAAAEAGIECDSECQEILREGIEDFVAQTQQAMVNRTCMDVEEAHRHGIEPMCLPDGITAVPAPGTDFQPARVEIQITRRSEPVDVAAEELNDYYLDIQFQGFNDTHGDSILVQTNTGFYEGGYSVEFISALLPLSGPLEGMLFHNVRAKIPPLTPSEETTVTFWLQPADYWIPGHKELIAAEGGFVRYNDWWKLYYKGKVNIDAAIQCRSTAGGLWTGCGGTHATSFDLPTSASGP
jgi:LysM repeat protein